MKIKRLKSLMYREFMLTKGSCILGFGITCTFVAMGWLIALSMKIGNLAKLLGESGADAQFIKDMVYNMFAYLSCIFVPTGLTHDKTIIKDIQSNWRVFNITLPQSENESVLAKTLIDIVNFLIMTAIIIINGAVLSDLLGRDFTFTEVNRFMLIIAAGTVFTILANAISLAAREIKETYLAYTPAFVTIIIAMVVLKDDFVAAMTMENSDLSVSLNEIFEKVDTIAPFAIPAIILFFVMGYFLSVLAMKRRYK